MDWPGRIASAEEVVRAGRAPDPESVERASRGFNEKYVDSPYLHTMVRPEIEPTTVRLEPR